MHVQSCCFAHLNLLLFCHSRWRRRCLGSDPHRLLGGCAGKWVKIRPLKQTYNAISRIRYFFFVSNNGKGVNPHISVSHCPHHFPIISDLIDVPEPVDCKTVFLFRSRTGARVVKRLWKEWGDNENGEWKWGFSFLAWLAHDFEGKNDNNNNCFAV